MTSTMVFDIETVPDTEGGRRLYDLGDLDEVDTARAMGTLRRARTGDSDFLPHYLHRIVAISIAFRNEGQFRVWSLGGEQSTEKELIQRFFDGLERYTPTLVSWNGGGFDLPVLHYRSLLHHVDATSYWETGDHNREFRYNNYLGRFHWRHIDLMDVLAGFQMRAVAPLDHIASLLGYPGKQGISGADVHDYYLAGRIGEIRDYCETDVLNTYLVYLRWQRLRGDLGQTALEEEENRVRNTLQEDGRPHLLEFLEAWKKTA